ncbi:MAG: DUF11 domain-containing protein [Anaerolineales bacterium]|nr:DUF11 domain-containing protein [Anaerolineales bacterium]
MTINRTIRLIWAVCLPIALLAVFVLHSAAWQSQPTAVSPTPLPLVGQLNQSDSGLSFVLNTAVFQTAAEDRIQVEGLDQVMNTSGAPALPYYTTFIAVPPEAEVTVTVAAQESMHQHLTRLAAAPEPALNYANAATDGLFPPATAVPQSAQPAMPDPAVYSRDALYPTAVYELSAPMYYRDIRIVQLKLYPVRYNPVQQEVVQDTKLQVNVTFNGANLTDLRPSPTPGDIYLNALADRLLNPGQAAQWRSLPAAPDGGETAVTLPIGQPTLKIEVARDGIYEINYTDLQTAGMLPLNPNTIEMMHRGETVAYQFIGDSSSTFDPGEKIRFYGWAINESRYEKQLVRNNVFWLWDGGTRTAVASVANQAGGSLPVKTTYWASVTREDEKYFFSTWTNQWDQFPNEPDSYYWDWIRKTGASPHPYTVTRQIELPDPVLDAGQPPARYVIELMTREAATSPKTITYDFIGCINSYPDCQEEIWGQPGDPIRGRNVNITNTVPATALVDGLNNVQIIDATQLNGQVSDNYLNRITVEYMRHLIALNNQLVFTDETGGSELRVSGFSEGNAANALVWDISSPRLPKAISMAAGNVSGSAGNYTYKFSDGQPANTQFIAASADAVLSGSGVITFSQYIPANLTPPGGADWVAISHGDFLTQAQQLAAHRSQASFGGLTTYVADVEDVINQYGFGLPLPAAIHDYLQEALYNWSTAPAYVVLVGDGLVAPRNLPCVSLCTDWDINAVSYVPTDLLFVDRFQGLVPSDHTAVLLSGNDILADMAIGRIPAKSAAEAQAAVDKIIQHDQDQLTPAAWQKTVIFVADDPDQGGNFCFSNLHETGPLLPGDFQQAQLCLEASNSTAVLALRQQITNALSQGASILNYRGHGGVEYWGSNPYILTVRAAVGDMTETFWNNYNKPLTILSADCLDGNFAFPGRNALSERTLTAAALSSGTIGSAAHWSSSGLGYDAEHTVLLEGFYRGLFEEGQTAVGDAANYAKVFYDSSPFSDRSAIYNFILQGDPAMQLYRPEVSLNKTAQQSSVELGSTAVFNLHIHNNGIYPAKPTITDTLPSGLAYVSATASVPYAVTTNGNNVFFSLETGLAQGESAMITVTTTAVAVQSPATNVAVVQTPGNDLNPANQTSSAAVSIFQDLFEVYLPNIIK